MGEFKQEVVIRDRSPEKGHLGEREGHCAPIQRQSYRVLGGNLEP